MDLVKKTMEALAVPTVGTTLLVDGFAYGGCPALATMEDRSHVTDS